MEFSVTEPTHSNVYEAINAVMQEIGYVYKGTKVDMGGGRSYRAAGEAELLKALRPVMVRHGLMIMPIQHEVESVHEMLPKFYRGKKEGERSSRTVRVNSIYRIAHVSGQYVDVAAAGEGQDTGDKATAKALTIAMKYALRQSFALETGDDPDRERPERQFERTDTPDVVGAAKKRLRQVFGDNHAEAGLMVKESTGLDLREALSDSSACQVIINALSKES